MNIRMPIFAFILLGILLCAFAGLAFFFFLYDHRDKYYRFEDDAVMTGKDFFCEFRRFGGEENIEISFKLIYEGGETAELLYCKTVSDGSRSKKKLYTIPKETVDKLKAIYREHCVPVLADAHEKEDIAADAPTVVVCFAADEDKESYTISSDQELPEKNQSIFTEVEDLLSAYRPHYRSGAVKRQ